MKWTKFKFPVTSKWIKLIYEEALDAGADVVPWAALKAAIEATMMAITAKIAEKFILVLFFCVLRFKLNSFKIRMIFQWNESLFIYFLSVSFSHKDDVQHLFVNWTNLAIHKLCSNSNILTNLPRVFQYDTFANITLTDLNAKSVRSCFKSNKRAKITVVYIFLKMWTIWLKCA